MKKLGTLFILALAALTVYSCKQEKKAANFLPGSTGSENSLMVVMDNSLWQGEVGEKVREVFATPAVSLMPEQAILTLTQIPPQVFKGATTHARSVLFVQKDTLTIAHVKRDVYADPQNIAVVKGKTNAEIVAGIEKIGKEAITAFKAVEIAAVQERFNRSLSKETAIEDELGVKLTLPSVYRVGKQEKNFVWVDRQIPKGNMNIIAYSIPEKTFTSDSTFVQDIVKLRDSIGKKYVPGPDAGTYMMTEKAFAPYVFPAEIGGRKAAEVRGIWEINGYPMAGPFLMYIINDKPNKRKLVLEGFTFAPNTQKRDYMFELEAVLKTVEFSNETEMASK